MTRAEYQEITDRTLAMTPEEVDCVLDSVPDAHLLRQVIARYAYLMDYKASIEDAIKNVNLAHSKEATDDLVGWM